MGSGIQPGMMKYCVIGNIVKEHIDEERIVRYGTLPFPGGRKVYISTRFWDDVGEVTVMGLNRFKSKYILERVPLNLIENIRASKTFDLRVLKLMQNDFEYRDMWFLYKEEDRIRSEQYAQMLKLFKAGDATVFEKYYRDFMYQFYSRK